MDATAIASVAVDVTPQQNDAVDLRASATPSVESSSNLQNGDNGEESELMIDDDDHSAPDGLMCGSSFAMGVVGESGRSPTPLINNSPDSSSVGAVDEDSFSGNHSPHNSSTTISTSTVNNHNQPPRRSLPSSNANVPQLPPDTDILHGEFSDMLKAEVLKTIDDLRRRKARPNLKNIGHMMQRRHGCSPRQVEALLEFLVEQDTVIKVDYKGQASYRNASKWKKGNILKGL